MNLGELKLVGLGLVFLKHTVMHSFRIEDHTQLNNWKHCTETLQWHCDCYNKKQWSIVLFCSAAMIL